MDLRTFQELSKRTTPFNGQISNQIEFENMLGNYAMGMAGEWFELQTEVNNKKPSYEILMKEAGDVLHYAVGLLELLGYKANEKILMPSSSFKDVENAFVTILEGPKKHIYHRHELPKLEMISAINVVISHIADYFDLRSVCEMNIDKLKTRYPEKFNTADSIARVDVVEGK